MHNVFVPLLSSVHDGILPRTHPIQYLPVDGIVLMPVDPMGSVDEWGHTTSSGLGG